MRRRGSSRAGKKLPSRNLGMCSSTSPALVDSSRVRLPLRWVERSRCAHSGRHRSPGSPRARSVPGAPGASRRAARRCRHRRGSRRAVRTGQTVAGPSVSPRDPWSEHAENHTGGPSLCGVSAAQDLAQIPPLGGTPPSGVDAIAVRRVGAFDADPAGRAGAPPMMPRSTQPGRKTRASPDAGDSRASGAAALRARRSSRPRRATAKDLGDRFDLGLVDRGGRTGQEFAGKGERLGRGGDAVAAGVLGHVARSIGGEQQRSPGRRRRRERGHTDRAGDARVAVTGPRLRTARRPGGDLERTRPSRARQDERELVAAVAEDLVGLAAGARSAVGDRRAAARCRPRGRAGR